MVGFDLTMTLFGLVFGYAALYLMKKMKAKESVCA
jgi:hypothetical protein